MMSLSKCHPTTLFLLAALPGAAGLSLACESTETASASPPVAAAPAGISPQQMADALHTVMAADRTIYTKNVVNRLQNVENVIKASEQWIGNMVISAGARSVQSTGASCAPSRRPSVW
jgi:hypothetical protein